jgi:hypothetical protein
LVNLWHNVRMKKYIYLLLNIRLHWPILINFLRYIEDGGTTVGS